MITTTTSNSTAQRTTTATVPQAMPARSVAQDIIVAATEQESKVVSLIRAGVAQTAGQKSSQEDAADLLIPADPKMAERGSLFLLTEGAGMISLQSHNSKAVAKQVRESFYGSICSDAGRALRSALVSSNRLLHKQSTEKLGATRQGVLCVAATVQGDKLWLASAGRAIVYIYSARTSGLNKVELGSNVNNSRLGMVPDIEPAIAGPITIGGGDLVLLSSDGLFNLLEPEIVHHYMASSMQTSPAIPAPRLADALVRAARFRDVEDNATAIVLRCHGVLPARGAAEYGWPNAYAMNAVVSGEESIIQVQEPQVTISGLAAQNLRNQASVEQKAPAAVTTAQPATYSQYITAAEAKKEAAVLAAQETAPRLLRPFSRKGKSAVTAPAPAQDAQHQTVDLAPLAQAGQQEGPQTAPKLGTGLPRLSRGLRWGQRVAGWLVAGGSMVPLIAALYIEIPYLVSAEGLFFLGLATGGTVCSVNAAIALKKAKATKPAKAGKKGKGSADAARQRLLAAPRV